MTNSLDLRYDGVLPIELAKELTKLEASIRKEYTDYVGELSKVNMLSGLDWLVNVTCRNPYQTKIFDNFCKLKLLDYCIDQRLNIDTVLVSNQGMKEAVHSLCNNRKVSLNIISKNEDSENFLFFIFRRLLVSVYVILISFLIPRLIVRGKKHLPDSSIIYVDLYAKASDFDSRGVFEDKYYTGMKGYMQKKDRSRVWYVPFIYPLMKPLDLKWIIDKSRKSESNFLIMEEWLKLTDYLYSFYQSLVLPLKVKVKPLYNDIDVSKMISQEVSKDLLSSLLSRNVLVYCFIERLKKSKIKIDKVVDWNENQVVDRSLNLAIRNFYPHVKTIGYQGFIVSGHHVSHSPSCYEVEAGIIPDKTCVISPEQVQSRKKFCSIQGISVAPAFRFQKLFEYSKGQKNERDLIVIALPYFMNISKIIVDECLTWYKSCGVKFIIKKHPAVTMENLLSSVAEIENACFEITETPLQDLFYFSRLVISYDSSACLEAVLRGVHVIIMGNRTGATFNPLDGIVDPTHWDVCYDYNCMQEVYEKNTIHRNLDVNLLLTPVTEMTVKSFLECDYGLDK